MKKIVLLLLASGFFLFVHSQNSYWQQRADYIIDVKLNAAEKTLDGFEKITYYNNSPDTLHFIWFHIWPNAYKTDRTAFSDQLLRNGDTRFYFSEKEERGYINRLDFKVNNLTAKTEDHPNHIDIIKILLPKPAAPGETINISTPFHVKLPFNISRSGYAGGSIQATQWFPKPAVYDNKGWHPMPYLNLGEYYSNFGSYDVRITVPANYVVAATGVLEDKNEIKWMLAANRDSTKNTGRNKKANTTGATITEDPATKTLRFTQDSIIDFAWFADPSFIVDHDTISIAGKTIDAFTYYTPSEKNTWKNSLAFTKDAIRFYSTEVGTYPYDVVSVVQGPQSFAGGMEYPTITLISPMPDEKSLDRVIAHEVGHNWFQAILASNERMYPWMDEGINSFYEMQYMQKKYDDKDQLETLVLNTLIKQKDDQPISTHAADFNEINYGLVAYKKTALWMQLLQEKTGADNFRKAMQSYYQNWKFRHPTPGDFKAVMKEHLQTETANYFDLLDKQGSLPGSETKGFQVMTIFKSSTFKKYFQDPKKNALIILPAMGANVYDKFMLGLVLTNYKLPPNKFQFAAIPMYAFGSNQLNGLGRISYTDFFSGKLHRLEIFGSLSSFSNDETDAGQTKLLSRFTKLSGGAELSFRNNVTSTARKYIQWKSFFINEQPFRFAFDSVFTGTDTSITTVASKTELRFPIHQLRLGIENKRALYPYQFDLQLQGMGSFLRLTMEGNYFFNYREGGLNARFFAGKFFYDKGEQYPYGFNIDRFFLSMSGIDGYNDYTYSHYYAGRNRFEGFASRQIAIRDGGFKTRTEQLANPVGQSDDWLAAVNLNTTIPKKLNPLSVLPVKIPLHLFADFGTYADAWEEDLNADRILFDAGLHLPLFNGIVNFYFPVVSSSSFRDYHKSIYTEKRFIRSMSFTIDLHKLPAMIKKDLHLQ